MGDRFDAAKIRMEGPSGSDYAGEAFVATLPLPYQLPSDSYLPSGFWIMTSWRF